MNLQIRYASMVIALIVIIVIALSGTLFFQFKDLTEELGEVSAAKMKAALNQQMVNKGKMVAATNGDSLTNALYQFDMDRMQNQLISIKVREDVIYTYIFDDQGKILHDGSNAISHFGQQLDTFLDVRLDLRQREVYEQIIREQLVVVKPILIDDEILGGLVIGFSLHAINQDILTTQQEIGAISDRHITFTAYAALLTTLVLVCFGIALAYPVTRSMVLPIRKLVQLVQEIGKGKYDAKLEIAREDEIGQLAKAFNHMTDSLQRSNQRILHIAYHDDLTQLPNRRLFMDYLGRVLSLAKRTKKIFAVLFIDLDDFKRVNDTLGHDVGDELLKEASFRIVGSLRAEDIAGITAEIGQNLNVSRLGGDEFTIILPNIKSPLDASIVAKRIIGNLAEPFFLKQRDVTIGTSIGITVFPDDGTDAKSMLKNADIAMYQAKENGKNQYQFFTQKMNDNALAKLAIESSLRKALKKNELTLHYQPKIKLPENLIVGAEALIRWHHPENGWISPASFIPIAEETGLILAIGEWVIEQACRDLKALKIQGLADIGIAINVSSQQIHQQEVDTIVALNLELHELDAPQLEIEITETALLEDDSNTRDLLQKLRDRGMKVWLDDFGTGYSSLSHLRQFSVSGVKIDRSFISDVHTNENDEKLVSAIISMADSLSIPVIAEGIENPQHLEVLVKNRCHLAQGYYFSPPVPLQDFMELLKSSASAAFVRH